VIVGEKQFRTLRGKGGQNEKLTAQVALKESTGGAGGEEANSGRAGG